MTNGILRFNTNGPVEVPLRWDGGTRVEGRYREQVSTTLRSARYAANTKGNGDVVDVERSLRSGLLRSVRIQRR